MSPELAAVGICGGHQSTPDVGVQRRRTRNAVVVICVLLNGVPGMVAAQWTTRTDGPVVDMGALHLALSAPTTPVEPLDPPFSGVEAQLVVVCGGPRAVVSVLFTHAPELVGSPSEDGYRTVDARMRWDEFQTTTTLRQFFDARSLGFLDAEQAVRRLRRHDRLLLEGSFFRDVRVSFAFDLAGSASAIDAQLAKCGRGDSLTGSREPN